MISVISIYVFFFEFSYVRYLYFENGLSTNLYYIYFYFTIFCIFTLTLTLNMYDGIDGQSLILYIFLSIYLYVFHQIEFCSYLILPLVFIFNLKPSTKNCLGDNGVMLSSVLSILLIKCLFKSCINICWRNFLILIIPALNLIRLFFYRICHQKKPNTLQITNRSLHHLN